MKTEPTFQNSNTPDGLINRYLDGVEQAYQSKRDYEDAVKWAQRSLTKQPDHARIKAFFEHNPHLTY